ncbi:DUF1353 domain-containing protein [Maritalea porphyrae]|uniref:DUF1353 domain-containing protein n=1 Tax=Maritalea porphyrae TaxID=880732 RepID=UPI0022AEF552|nr:DUF1353 domain-containing protein [Maritalea porphyrae]MCZ4272464.1 DUF1353 domain-containing protein [Maritalea porphyrae]
MSQYTSHQGAVHVGGIQYQFNRDLRWAVGHKDGEVFVVEAGTPFDVSVPWSLRWLISPHDHRYHKAAALHDEMLKKGWSRATAAAEFFNALKADDVKGIELWAMFLGVVVVTVR